VGALPFRDRADAGRELAEHLRAHAGEPHLIVLGLPRGGVPVAFEVARALKAPLDVFLVRKLGVPGHEELAMGAIASGGVRVINEEVVGALDVPAELIDAVAAREEEELQRRERVYRGDASPPRMEGATAMLVDDGLATGSSMRAAVAALREQAAARVVAAVPVAPPETCAALEPHVDEMVCAATPQPFRAVGLWYRDFTPTTDEEVHALLERAREASTSSPQS
jgi:putative phosphoribosyl transferase